MKRILTVALALIMCLGLASCAASDGSEMTASKTLDEIAAEIMETVPTANLMKIEDEATIADFTSYDVSKYASYAFYSPMIVNADTIHIVEVTDIADIEDAKTALQAEKDKVIQNFTNYLPDPLTMAEGGEIVTKGRYAMLIISADNATAIEIFNNAIS